MRLALLSLAVLLVVSCMAPVPPPPAGGTPSAATAEITFAVRPNPPIAGDESELVFTVRRNDRLIASGQAAAEVMVDMPGQPTRSVPVALDGDGSGHWWTTFTFPRAGAWTAAVRVTEAGDEPVEGQFQFDVAAP